MNSIVQFLVQHGYSILFAAVFARQIGLPVPANLFVLAAGAVAAAGRLAVVPTVCLAIIACVLADWCWYEAGRLWGDKVLHFIHQFARDPDAADTKARKHFARFGPPILVLAKFVPGLDLVAPPMAGTSRTSRFYFLVLESTGAALWATANVTIGYVFSRDLNRAAAYTGRAGTLMAVLLVFSLCIYAGFRMHRRHCRNRKERILANAVTDPTNGAVRANTWCGSVEGLNHAD